MTNRVERNRKKLLLLAAGWMAIAAPVQGQVLHADGPLPSFEVATIKPSGGGGHLHPPGTVPVELIPEILITRGLVGRAFGVNKSLVFGGPDWIDKQGYRIEAKIPDDLFAEMQKMPPDQKAKKVDLMEQSLLAERYKLKVHFETREMPVYELIVAKGGLKITKNKDDDFTYTGMGLVLLNSGARLNIQNSTMAAFASSMQNALVDRPVIDRTGIVGRFTFRLMIAPDGPMFNGIHAAGASDDDITAPSLFTAIQDLGLKLEPAKDPVEVVVIDHIEMPSPN